MEHEVDLYRKIQLECRLPENHACVELTSMPRAEGAPRNEQNGRVNGGKGYANGATERAITFIIILL